MSDNWNVIDDMNSVPEVCKKHKIAMRWYGDWYCSECQQEEEWLQQEDEARWFASCRKCVECSNAWGPDPGDKCDAYKMPLYMVKRKKKCKRFKEIDWSLETNYLY